MKSIVFDSGPLISLVTNNLLWVLEPLKRQFDGEFYITPSVKKELIDKPLQTKKFELEAMQMSQIIKDGTINVIFNKEIHNLTQKLLTLANHSFNAKGNWIKIVSAGEVETLAADAVLNSDASVVDERTIRLLLENSPNLTILMEKRMGFPVSPNKPKIKEFKELLSNVQIIRSTELIVIAYKMKLLDKYLIDPSPIIRDPKKRLLDAALWALKLRGASVSGKEISQLIKTES